ncbi:MAG: MFS transporter small subunit [Pseudonocardia sp.]
MPAQTEAPSGGRGALTVLAWLWVAVPFGYGGWQLLIKVAQLFSG